MDKTIDRRDKTEADLLVQNIQSDVRIGPAVLMGALNSRDAIIEDSKKEIAEADESIRVIAAACGRIVIRPIEGQKLHKWTIRGDEIQAAGDVSEEPFIGKKLVCVPGKQFARLYSAEKREWVELSTHPLNFVITAVQLAEQLRIPEV